MLLKEAIEILESAGYITEAKQDKVFGRVNRLLRKKGYTVDPDYGGSNTYYREILVTKDDRSCRIFYDYRSLKFLDAERTQIGVKLFMDGRLGGSRGKFNIADVDAIVKWIETYWDKEDVKESKEILEKNGYRIMQEGILSGLLRMANDKMDASMMKDPWQKLLTYQKDELAQAIISTVFYTKMYMKLADGELTRADVEHAIKSELNRGGLERRSFRHKFLETVIERDYLPAVKNGDTETAQAIIDKMVDLVVSKYNSIKESTEILEKNNCIVEAEEPGYMRGEFNHWDRRRMEQGRPPIWAKSMKDIPARKKELRQSSSHAEMAMRSVNTEDGKCKMPYSESDWRRDMENAKAMNGRIAETLEGMVNKAEEIEANKDYVSVFTKADDGQLDEFRVYPAGPAYMIKFVGHRSVFDRDTQRCKTLADVAKYINNKE